jgi:hypothetical protein
MSAPATLCRIGLALACLIGLTGFSPDHARADVYSNVPEAAGYNLVYTLPIPNTAAFNTNAIPYSVNNAASTAYPFERIAYYLELQSGAGPLQYAYASMDAFTTDARKIGVPSRGPNGNGGTVFQQKVANMNVVSNAAGVVNGTGIATGNIEFWSFDYGGTNSASIPNAGGAFDFGDQPSSAGNYGSMQIHNHDLDGSGPGVAGQTVLAYNRWGADNGELGIGNAPGSDTDWTFANNRGSYTVKNLQVLVKQVAPQVPEAAGYKLVYKLPLADSAALNGTTVPYTINNASQIRQPLDRVAYYLELQKPGDSQPKYAWVSADAFTQAITKLGVPNSTSGASFQQYLKNMNVASNVAGVTNGTGIATGNIEFWPNNYDTQNTGQNSGMPAALNVPGANSGTYDFGDRQSSGGYGSMQIHNYDPAGPHTVFAYNRWGQGGLGASDLGIGNQPSWHPDWTFAQNAAGYTVKNLYVLAREDTTPGVFKNVPEAAGMTLVHALTIPDNANNMHVNGVPYSINNAASITRPIDRIGYYLELAAPNGELQYAYVSVDPFTFDASKIGVPVQSTGASFQQRLNNMNVVSNVLGVVTGNRLEGGNIEFWPNDYQGANAAGVPGASDSAYDFGDKLATPVNGYGSMQIHNSRARQTVLAYNAWGASGKAGDLGIGNQSSGSPDWTFANNVAGYRVKNLYTLVHEADAALMISKPSGRTIAQRDEHNQADIAVQGQYAGTVTRIEARAVPMDGSAQWTPWQTITDAPSGGNFSGQITLAGGWYQLQVRAFNGTQQVAQSTMDRIGVGEIFITAGQSNSANHGSPTQSPLDDRVSALTSTNPALGQWVYAQDPQPIATGTGGSPWPALGDLLADELDVPIGFVSVGWGGTRVDQWLPGGSLYPRLHDALDFLGPEGFRAILWHQGESDASAGTSTADYAQRLQTVIDQTRIDAGWDIPWGVALVSYLSGNSAANMANVIAGQQLVIDNDPLTLLGASTDDLIGSAWRWDGVHFNTAGLQEHARRWLPVTLQLSVPEPSTYLLLLVGLALAAIGRRRVRS